MHIPKRERQALLKRLLVVWCVALIIALMQWVAANYAVEKLTIYLVYSYSISTCVWFFSDPCRYLIKGEQAKSWLNLPFLAVGSVLGYALGTWIGDSYAGWSTFDLWRFAPAKFAGLLVGSAFISAAFVAYFKQRSKAERIEREKTEAQLRLLQSQLEPHMLFNTLANLRVLMAHDVAQAQTMLDNLIGFLRTTLQASRQTHHSVQAEFACLSDYLQLMQIRMGNRLRFRLDTSNDAATQLIPSLILQPLVENSIRHGLEPKVQGGELRISAQVLRQRLCLQVKDSGMGFEALSNAPSASYGLSHVRQRLHTLYGAEAELRIEDTPTEGGACVTLTIPLSTAASSPSHTVA